MNDTKYEIPEDLKAAWDVLPQNCWERQLIERIGELLSENKRLRASVVSEFVQFLCGFGCDQCARGVPVLRNSVGFWSHREEGNYCSNHSIYAAYEKWLAARQSAKEPPSPPSTKESRE